MGLEPMTTGLKGRGELPVSAVIKGLAGPTDSACTSACTKSPEMVHSVSLESLAATLLNLSPEDREQLARMIAGDGKKAR